METILKLEKIRKTYGGIVAVNDVSLDFKKGEVHAIVGENGAGKSTFIKIITGAERPSSGNIYIEEKLLKSNNPKISLENKIAAVYQELNLVPSLKVYENVFLGIERKKWLFLDRKNMKNESLKFFDSLNVKIEPDEKLSDMGMGNRQIVEIVKALVREAKVIVFDEPTASLTEQETNRLKEIIIGLKAKGLAIIYISHKLEEVFQIADRISVFRDGKLIETRENKVEENILEKKEYLIKQIAGRNIKFQTKENFSSKDVVLLELKNFGTSKVRNINLQLKKGEILSISGLLGSRRTEVLQGIFGIDKKTTGEIFVKEKPVSIGGPKDAIDLGIGFVSEDRKDSGLFMRKSLKENVSIVFLEKFVEFGRINKLLETEKTEALLKKLKVKYSSLEQKASELSGGNQQKIAIGKWLIEELDIILLDEPTRGVDIGAKEEVYRLIFQFAEMGKGIILVSSEAEEVMRISDRTIVMSNGEMVSCFNNIDISAEKIFKASAEGKDYGYTEF